MDFALVDLGIRYCGHPRAVLEMDREAQVMFLAWAHVTAERSRKRSTPAGVSGTVPAGSAAHRFERGGAA